MSVVQKQINTAKHQLFHIVLAFLGLTFGFQKTAEIVNITATIHTGLLIFSLLVFIVVFALYFKQLVFNFKNELHRVKHNNEGHYSAFSMSLILTGLLLQPYDYQWAFSFWSLGSVLQFVITAYVIKGWLYHEHWQMTDMTPIWFLPISGVLLIPLGIPEFAPLELGWMLLSLGLVFWLVLFSLMLYRLFFLPLLSKQQELSLFILASPPALAFLSYVHITQMEAIDLIGRLLFYTSLFFSLLLLSQFKRFIVTPFCNDWWRIPFPFALITVANMTMFQLLSLSLYGYIAILFLSLLSVIVLHLSMRTVLTYQSESP
ncbi:MAG: hypothetical protein U9R28_04690 [Pseudomonadota bacterium]|nr:hypothetical protein [Pseudomonadota bacterium]